MKILIAYYSKRGKTKELAEILKNEFEKRGHLIETERIKALKEHNVFAWFFIRMFKGRCKIQDLEIKDVSGYDLILLGSPNWTRLALPVAEYLKKVKGIEYKSVGFFATTLAPPAFEWYVISAYLLDSTFSKAVEEKKARIVASLFLSSGFKRWNPFSNYGKRKIKAFCDQVEKPISFIKKYFSEKKDYEALRFFAVNLSFLFVLLLFLYLILSIFKINLFAPEHYLLLFFILLSSFLLLTLIKREGKNVFLGKYIGSVFLVLFWTLVVLFLEPTLGLGRILLWGYFLIFILVGFLREQKLVLFTGLTSVLSYGFLFFYSFQKEVFRPEIDLAILFLTITMVAYIARNLENHLTRLFEMQEEIETAKDVLGLRIEARVRELKELTGRQEEIIEARTKEIKERMKELEKFYSLAVGRELKMTELKKEIKELKEELGKK